MFELRTSSQREIYHRLRRYLKPYHGQFAVALVCMVLFGASDGAIPFLIKHILDGVFAERNRDLLFALPVALIVFAVFRGLADFGQEFLISRIGHNIVRDIRNQINRHLLSLSPGYFVRNQIADLASRITSDVVLIRTLLTSTAAAILRDVIRVVALLTAAFYLDPVLAAIAFVVFPIGVYPVVRFGKRIRKLSKVGQDAIGGLSATLQESMVGNRVVKIFGREKFEQQRFEEKNQLLTNTFVKSDRIRALTGPVNEVLAIAAIAGIILYGGYSVIDGIRTQGDFIAFLTSVFLLYDPFKKLTRISSVVQQGVAGADRIFEILDAVPEISDPVSPVPLGSQNLVELKSVTFGYPGNDEPVLSDVSLKFEEGSKIALVGFSGAGKSTLIDLIPRFIDPQQGTVLVGGVDVRTVAVNELRQRIAYVGQHTFLFNDTIYNNIAYGNPNVTREDIIRAAKAAFAYDFVMKFPAQFDTLVGEGGMSLSGGERQRVSIARAILKNAPILILDEATASLDNQSEREVQKALEELEKNRTSIVIAHRLSTVRTADRIIVLDRGRVVEQGTHDALLEMNGAYAKLYRLQFAEHPPQEAVAV